MIFWFTLIVKKKKVIASYMQLGGLHGFARDFNCHLRVSPSLCFYVSIILSPHDLKSNQLKVLGCSVSLGHQHLYKR